ncbi:TPA: hypothetical protein N0F65_004111 [Lagenidium giganteum]|uniref:Uncharacterized protein n=1 Tax=Lagenidium giganteum TaxID=4803 RepID=A0AAV2ZEF0_9STRA|nr:TPA: hypothetical protein N0F65_004111 [Lagenidium giganteum]
MLRSVLLMALMVTLDLQGLIYKLSVLGPHEKAFFRTKVFGVVCDEPLAPLDPLFNSTRPNDDLDSSWPHWLSSCQQLHAADAGGGFFVIAAGKNCTIGNGSARRTEPHVVLTSSVRLDSIVWTSCRLLFQGRQPSICRDAIVKNFLDRYMLDTPSIPVSQLAPPGSEAEEELLGFLDMVSSSYPHHKMVCVEGFVWPDQAVGTYMASFLGCASPNLFQTAVVGLLNPKLVELHRRRLWLTADVFEVFGLQFRIRQNNLNHYEISRTSEDELLITSFIQPNFSCFGGLYIVMITLDVMLLTEYVRASWEVVHFVLVPQTLELQQRMKDDTCMSESSHLQKPMLRSHNQGRPSTSPCQSTPRKKQIPRILTKSVVVLESSLTLTADEDLNSPVPCSLYRSGPVMLAVLATQLISWLVVMPNSVVWVWGDSTSTKIQAYLCSLRVWVLTLITCNLVWSVVVRISERGAYFITSRTYITTVEIIVIAAIVAALERQDVFTMCEHKWQREHKRHNDATAFQGNYVAHANTFQPLLDELHSTPLAVLWIVYGPLCKIVGKGILAIAGFLSLKGVALWYFTAQEVPLESRRGPTLGPRRARHFHLHGREYDPYARLPLEVLLDLPMRASCLVRDQMSMEVLKKGERTIRPSCFLNFGVLPRDGFVQPRAGFASASGFVLQSLAGRSLRRRTNRVRPTWVNSDRGPLVGEDEPHTAHLWPQRYDLVGIYPK